MQSHTFCLAYIDSQLRSCERCEEKLHFLLDVAYVNFFLECKQKKKKLTVRNTPVSAPIKTVLSKHVTTTKPV